MTCFINDPRNSRKHGFAWRWGRLGLGLAVWLALAWGNLAAAAGESFVNVPVLGTSAREVGSTQTLVAAVFVEKSPMSEMGPDWREKMLPNPIIMVYSDGTLVWSKDPIGGGAPLYKSAVDKTKVAEVLRRFKEKKYFGNNSLARPNFGPDASYTSIYLRSGDEILDMRSWHELAEQNPGTVAASTGLSALGKRNRDEVLKNDTREYQNYRAAWADIKRNLLGLIPKETVKPSEGLKVKGIKPITIPKKQN